MQMKNIPIFVSFIKDLSSSYFSHYWFDSRVTSFKLLVCWLSFLLCQLPAIYSCIFPVVTEHYQIVRTLWNIILTSAQILSILLSSTQTSWDLFHQGIFKHFSFVMIIHQTFCCVEQNSSSESLTDVTHVTYFSPFFKLIIFIVSLYLFGTIFHFDIHMIDFLIESLTQSILRTL